MKVLGTKYHGKAGDEPSGLVKGHALQTGYGGELFPEEFLKSSSFYNDYLERNEEVNKHKWYESERAGKDVGIDYAFFDWLLKYRSQWRSKK